MEIVAYEPSFGEIHFPEGFEATLRGLSVEEQMERYRTTGSSSYSHTGYSERTSSHRCRKLTEDSDVAALIVKDDLLVGVMLLNTYGRSIPCLPEQSVCTYYACDNNGAGEKVRIDYTWLLCVMPGFKDEEE